METFNNDQIKTLLGMTVSRVKDISDALERNWLIQMICAAAGVALVYDIAGLPKAICKYFGQETCSSQSAAIVLLVVELYYFMKFGHYVTAFLEVRKLLDSLMDTYVGASDVDELTLPLRDSLSFFEGYYSRSAFNSWAPLRIAYFMLFLVVVATGQAASLFLLFHDFGLNPISLLLGSFALISLLILYVGFWYSKRKHPYTTQLVFGSMTLVAAVWVLFWQTAR